MQVTQKVTPEIVAIFQQAWNKADLEGLEGHRTEAGLAAVFDALEMPPVMGEVTFTEYQQATRETAIYPGAQTGDIRALAYVGLGLGETGEVQGKIKKILRDEDGVVTGEKATAIIAEAGDVLWYLARLADELGYSLGDIAAGNLDKLRSRKERGVLGGSGDNR